MSNSNATIVTTISPHWTFSSIWTLMLCVFVTIFDSIALYAFLKDRRLRTEPFNVYLMFLLISNIIYAVLQNPLDIINSLYFTWWLGSKWCIVYLYSTHFLSAIQMLSHVLISASRVWAMTFPISYHRYHSHTLAICLCGCVFIYAHAIQLPEFVHSVQKFREPLEIHGCQTQYINSAAIQFAIYAFADVFMLLAYPFVCYKRHQRRRVRGNSVCATFDAKIAMETSVQPNVGVTRKRDAKENYGFLVLSLLTASVFVCWTPATVLFLIETYLPGRYSQYFSILLPIFSTQPLLDPFLFAAALSELRRAVREAFAC